MQGSLNSGNALNSTKPRLDFIDALRGFACLWVLLHHSFEHVPLSDHPLHWPLNALILFSRIGWLGVSLFLVLSGFCLYYPLVRQNDPAQVRLNWKSFARRRAWRILPPYYVALLAFTAIAIYGAQRGLSWGEAIGWKDVVSHLLMLHNLRPSTFASINPALWSLALEVQLYVVFPLLVIVAARFGLRTMALLCFSGALVWQTAAFFKFGLALHWGADLATYYHALPARLFEFALGMVTARLVANGAMQHSRLPKILLLVLLLPATWFALTISRFGPLLDQVWGILFASAILLLAGSPHRWFESWLRLRWLVFMGGASYSIYLIHQPLIAIIAPAPAALESLSLGNTIGLGMLRLLLLVALGLGFYFLFERPFIAGKSTASRPAPPAPGLSRA